MHSTFFGWLYILSQNLIILVLDLISEEPVYVSTRVLRLVARVSFVVQELHHLRLCIPIFNFVPTKGDGRPIESFTQLLIIIVGTPSRIFLVDKTTVVLSLFTCSHREEVYHLICQVHWRVGLIYVNSLILQIQIAGFRFVVLIACFKGSGYSSVFVCDCIIISTSIVMPHPLIRNRRVRPLIHKMINWRVAVIDLCGIDLVLGSSNFMMFSSDCFWIYVFIIFHTVFQLLDQRQSNLVLLTMSWSYVIFIQS